MYVMSECVLQLIKGQFFIDFISLLDNVLEEVYVYGKQIICNFNLRKIFVFNVLVGVDNVVWVLYVKENGMMYFDELILVSYQFGLLVKYDKVVVIFVLGYGIFIEMIKQMVDDGFFIMKIKIGVLGDQKEMLEKDKVFLKVIYEVIGYYEIFYFFDGKIFYYFDVNGCYDK